jgi:hypothetical protein
VSSRAFSFWSSTSVTLALLLLITFPNQACAAPFAYVPNEGSGTISIIDMAPDGNRVYVSNGSGAAVQVIDIAVGNLPWGVAVR